MARGILIIGKSGSGKSSSLRSFKNNEYALINPLGKDLPFKTDKGYIETFKYSEIKTAMKGYEARGVKTIVLDDIGYLLTNELMNAAHVKDIFKHYRDIATDFYELHRFVTKELDPSINVYFMMHENVNDVGEIKPKTVGKMLDDQVTIEGLFTIVLRALKTSEGHKFQTQTEGNSVVKSPLGMFEDNYIDNDLLIVNDIINEYYGNKKVEAVVNE